MATYQLNVALWQIPTMVISDRGSDAETTRERELGNTVSNRTIDERADLLERRIEKAMRFFAANPPPRDTRAVSVFAAPEYLFAQGADSHFISQADKDRLLSKLKELTKRYPDLVLFPGTIAWKKAARRSNALARTFLPDRAKIAKKRIDAFSTYQDSHKKRFEAKRAADEDFWLAENTCFVLHNGKTLLKYHKRNDGGEVNRGMDGDDVFWVPGPRDSIFSHEGLEFGLQICAEMGSELSRNVDVQVAISASHPLRENKLKLKPGGYACHADAAIAPRVLRNDPANGLQEVVPNVRRHGGGTLSSSDATQRATQHVSKEKIEEQATVLRGRSRYYILGYDRT